MTRWVVERVETALDRFQLGPVSLDLSPGSAVAVLGTSGAGKTTLLRTLAGFLRPRQGRILRDGVDISQWLPEERGLGYVPQGLGLFPQRTVVRNIRYPMEIRGLSDAGRRTAELMERFHLTGLADRYPSRLSGGEQQRVAIARALAAEPTLIVWDEPWQGLDVVARYELGQVLHELRETDRIPMVVVTHDPSLAFSVADTFLLLRNGQVQDQCDATSLLRAPSDAFAARFVGYENVFESDDLRGGAPGAFRAWLRQQAGPDGIAFPSPDPSRPPSNGPLFELIVRSARPGPTGVTIDGHCDELPVSLRRPPPVAPPLPAPGTRLRFSIPSETLLPLGPRRPPGVGT